MVTSELNSKLTKLKEEVWELARQSLEERETHVYRCLVGMAENLTMLIASPSTQHGSSITNTQQFSDSKPVLIFARYKGEKYDAHLNRSRINGGRGHCVRFRDKWMTPSAAANSITETMVNGWRFWKYYRPDGTVGGIDELR